MAGGRSVSTRDRAENKDAARVGWEGVAARFYYLGRLSKRGFQDKATRLQPGTPYYIELDPQPNDLPTRSP